MAFPHKMIWSCVALLILITASVSTVSADVSGPVVPPGFTLARSDVGVALYQKNYPGGSPDFVQVVSLDQGAMLKPLITSIADPRQGKGVYGGSDARVRSQSLSAYWSQFSGSYPSAFCVANGQFFYMKEYPTRLPFPLKIDGDIVTDGYGSQQFPGQKLILELWPDRADITPLSKEALYTSTAPDIIAGLTEDAPKQKKRYTGRTFVGLDDLDGNGQFETLLVVTTKTARQIDAADVLRSFGADKVMMLDGGGSTQLSCRGDSYIFSERILPQAIGILAGPDETAKLAAGDQVAQVVSPTLTEEESQASGQDPDTQTLTIQSPTQNQVTQPDSLQTESLPPSLTEEIAPPQPTEMASLFVEPSSQAQPESAALNAPVENGESNQPGGETQAQAPQPQLEIEPAAAPAVEPPTDRGLAGSETVKRAALASSPDLKGELENKATLMFQAQQYLNMVANGYKSPAGKAPLQEKGTGNLSTNPATGRAAQSMTSAAGQPIQISGVLWVPASMLPVVLILLFAVAKIRRVQD